VRETVIPTPAERRLVVVVNAFRAAVAARRTRVADTIRKAA
jgi:hypothetical protein